MNILSVIWDFMNGKKFNTGTIMVVAVYIFQHFGMDHDAAVSMCTNIMLGIGGVTALVGFIHQLVKGWQEKKAMQVPPVLKLLVLALFAGFLATPARAGDRFDEPFKYMFSPRPAATYHNMNVKSIIGSDSARLTSSEKAFVTKSVQDLAQAIDSISPIAYWEFKPVITVPSLRLQFSDRPGAQLDLTALSAVGAGVSYQRSILVNGKNASDVAFEGMILLTGPDPQDVSFGLAAGFFDNYLQIGGGYNAGKITDGHRWFAMVSTSFTLRQN